ncbi:hypothetical protein ACJX0J_015797, partial [Zea mays]
FRSRLIFYLYQWDEPEPFVEQPIVVAAGTKFEGQDEADCIDVFIAQGFDSWKSERILRHQLQLLNGDIEKHICDEVGDVKFSILVDETCHVSKRVQMSLVLIFVDKDDVLQESTYNETRINVFMHTMFIATPMVYNLLFQFF